MPLPLQPRRSRWSETTLAIAVSMALGGAGFAASSPLPEFEAAVLSGGTVTEQALLGQTTLLIVTPSRDAAKETRQWVQALHRNFDPETLRVRDVIALDLPFFMSTQDAIERARQKIPAKYHDRTWLLEKPVLEKALSIPPSSEDAFVFVLDPEGGVAARVEGSPTDRRIQQLKEALNGLP